MAAQGMLGLRRWLRQMPASAASTGLLALCTALKRLEGAQLVRALSLRMGGVFLESGVAIDSSATMIQDVAIAFKAKNFSNAITLGVFSLSGQGFGKCGKINHEE